MLLHQVCLCNDKIDIVILPQLGFFVMHHFVSEHIERFGIHVNTQTFFIFPYILDKYDVFT